LIALQAISKLHAEYRNIIAKPEDAMIAITFALPAESSGFVALVRNKRRAVSGDTEIIYGEINQRPVTTFHTGIGQKACQANIDNFLRVEHPDIWISSGFAGGVGEDLRVGDLFLGENFSDRELLSAAQRLLGDQNVRAAKLFTSTTIVDSAEQRNEIARAQGALAIDMETETIARACIARRIRMLSLRAISDSLDEPFPAPPHLLFDLERQRTNAAKLVLYFLKRPTHIVGFIRFAHRIARARRTLTNAIIVMLQDL
jgi:adenosylhomocysteine nucleosidase